MSIARAEPPLLRLLHVEDSDFDHEVVRAHVEALHPAAHWLRVETAEAFERALDEAWDAVICDYNLPGCSGLDLLFTLRARDALTPFLLVSGEIGEDTAVAAMRAGASDYLLKSRLARLGPALDQSLKGAEAQRERLRAEQRLRTFAAQLQTRVEAERAAMARELHDDVGSALTALKFDLAWLARHSTATPWQPRIEQALETLDGAIEASRRLMLDLRPPILQEGLVPALQWLVRRFEHNHPEVQLDLQVPQPEPQLEDDLRLVAYRVAQEALQNVTKHARAQHVRLDLQCTAGVLSLEVQDDGQGMHLQQRDAPQRLGLRGLEERAASVGGWLDVSSRPGQGTLIALSVPLQDAPGLPSPSRPVFEVEKLS